MKPNQIALFGLALAQTMGCLSCQRSTPSEEDANTQAAPVPTGKPVISIPSRLDQLDPALVAMIERQLGVVRASPQNPMAHATLGLIYEANNLWTEARKAYETAYALNPDEPMGAHRAAIAAGTSGDFDGALSLLREAAGRFPDFAPIHHRLGDALVKTGRFEQAAGAFEQAIASAPDHPAGYIGLGDVNIRLDEQSRLAGRLEKAIELLQRAVELDPRSRQARYLLGTAYRNVGRDDEAREQLKLGINQQAGYASATTRFIPDAWSSRLHKYRVSALMAIETSTAHREGGRMDRAARVLEDALAFHPEEVDLLTRLGSVYLHAWRTEDALRVFLQADEIDGANLATCINLVTCYQRLERYDEALAAADRAVSVGPRVWQAHYNRAVALIRLERWDAADVALDTARGLAQSDPSALAQIDKLQQSGKPVSLAP